MVVDLGHEALNMRELARKVGVTATAIYHYFESREELLLQIKLRAVELLNDRIRALDPALSAHERLYRLGAEYVAFARDQPELYRLIFETPVGATPLGESDRSTLYFTYHQARSLLEEAHTTAGARDASYYAMVGWTMLHGFSSLLLTGVLELAEGMDRDRLTEIFLAAYAGGAGHG